MLDAGCSMLDTRCYMFDETGFLKMQIQVWWEWLSATIRLVDKLLNSRLESRSHRTKTNDDLLLSIKTVIRNAQLETRNP
jgi:hypothetical protein